MYMYLSVMIRANPFGRDVKPYSLKLPNDRYVQGYNYNLQSRLIELTAV